MLHASCACYIIHATFLMCFKYQQSSVPTCVYKSAALINYCQNYEQAMLFQVCFMFFFLACMIMSIYDHTCVLVLTFAEQQV